MCPSLSESIRLCAVWNNTKGLIIIECIQCTGCTVEQALESATLHPARLLGIESDIGTLNFGSRADFVLLNDDLFVQETYIGGQRVFPYPESQS